MTELKGTATEVILNRRGFRAVPALSALVLLSASLLMAQTGPLSSSSGSEPGASSPSQASPQGSPAVRRGRMQPCWQQAGISPAVVRQHREIVQNTRSEVQSVCSDSALTMPQKREKIQQIRASERQQMEALVTPQQAQSFMSCKGQRSEGRAAGGRSNPCAMANGAQLQPTVGQNSARQ